MTTWGVHRCDGCTRLYYPTPGEDAGPLRCDAVIVGLSDADVERAKVEGNCRHANVEKHGFQTKWTDYNDATPDADIANHSESAAAELAVAKVLGLPWSGEHGDQWIRTLDVHPYDVRFTRLRTPGLIIRPRDVDRSPKTVFVSVTGAMPIFTLHGWARPVEVAMDRFAVRSKPAYWMMPIAELHDLRRLPERRLALGIDDAMLSATYDDVPDDELD